LSPLPTTVAIRCHSNLTYAEMSRGHLTLVINAIALEGTEPAKFQQERAHNAVWPILYPDSEELPMIIGKLLHWIIGWITFIEDHPGSVNLENFKTAIPAKIVGVHPFIAANKRTGRLLAEMIAAKLNSTTYIYEFTKTDMRLHESSYDFTRFCWLRDYKALKQPHQQVRTRPSKFNQAQQDDEFRTLFSTFFFRK
jgi:hypothetical protein